MDRAIAHDGKAAVIGRLQPFVPIGRPGIGSVEARGLSGNRAVAWAIAACLVLQLAFVHSTPLQAVFASAPLAAADWAKVLLAGMVVFVVAEIEKAVRRRAAPAAAQATGVEPRPH